MTGNSPAAGALGICLQRHGSDIQDQVTSMNLPLTLGVALLVCGLNHLHTSSWCRLSGCTHASKQCACSCCRCWL